MTDIEAKLQKEREDGRKSWDHPVSFVLAAVGAAVGLGNVWRFPYLVSKYGGAPFLIPYLLVLFLVGMPMLGMELCIGTFFQAGDADAFGSMNPRLRGIGLASVFGGYAITFYYTIVLSWAGIYFIESFQATKDIPWIGDAEAHFNDIALAVKADDLSGAFNWKVFVSMLVMWIFIFLCIFKGVKGTGWVVKFTVPIPLIILIVLIIRGAFLEGAGDGILNYLIKWDGEMLKDPTIWASSIGQVFFSLGVCMGVMTAYSSHNKKSTTNVPACEKAITLSDTGIALIGGFAIYEMLGHMQFKCTAREAAAGYTGETKCDYYSKGSMGLAFMAYPEGMATLEAPQFWGIMFFGCLIMLGIDSAFALVETMTTVLKDCWIGLRIRPKSWTVALLCSVTGFLAGLLYVFDVGFIMLDVIDYYINYWGMVLVGMMECFAVGWVYQIDKQYNVVGRTAVLIYNIGFFISMVISTVLALALGPNTSEHTGAPLSGNDSMGLGIGIFLLGWIMSLILALMASKGNSNLSAKLWAIMGWHGPDKLRLMANNNRRKENEGKWEPNTWKSEFQALYRHDCFAISFGFLIKYFSCCLLWVISCINIKKDVYSPYQGYPERLLLVGRLVFVFMLFIIFSVAAFPRIMYDPKYSKCSTLGGKLMWYFTPKPIDQADLETFDGQKAVEHQSKC